MRGCLEGSFELDEASAHPAILIDQGSLHQNILKLGLTSRFDAVVREGATIWALRCSIRSRLRYQQSWLLELMRQAGDGATGISGTCDRANSGREVVLRYIDEAGWMIRA